MTRTPTLTAEDEAALRAYARTLKGPVEVTDQDLLDRMRAETTDAMDDAERAHHYQLLQAEQLLRNARLGVAPARGVIMPVGRIPPPKARR